MPDAGIPMRITSPFTPIPSNGDLVKNQPVKPPNVLCTHHVQVRQLMLCLKGLRVTPQPSLLLVQRFNDTRHKPGQQNLMPHLSHVLLLGQTCAGLDMVSICAHSFILCTNGS